MLYALGCGACGAAYNLADAGSDITLRELAELVARIAGRRVIFEFRGPIINQNNLHQLRRDGLLKKRLHRPIDIFLILRCGSWRNSWRGLPDAGLYLNFPMKRSGPATRRHDYGVRLLFPDVRLTHRFAHPFSFGIPGAQRIAVNGTPSLFRLVRF